MTTATITDLELLRTRVSGAVGRQMPEHIARLGWDAGRLAACQRDRLRALLARAIAGSPFHAGRLRGVDPDRFELSDLARLPAMTKADMMENFDAWTGPGWPRPSSTACARPAWTAPGSPSARSRRSTGTR